MRVAHHSLRQSRVRNGDLRTGSERIVSCAARPTSFRVSGSNDPKNSAKVFLVLLLPETHPIAKARSIVNGYSTRLTRTSSTSHSPTPTLPTITRRRKPHRWSPGLKVPTCAMDNQFSKADGVRSGMVTKFATRSGKTLDPSAPTTGSTFSAMNAPDQTATTMRGSTFLRPFVIIYP